MYGLKRTSDLFLGPDAGSRVVACANDAYKVTVESIHDEVSSYFRVLLDAFVLQIAGKMSHLPWHYQQHSDIYGMHASILCRGVTK